MRWLAELTADRRKHRFTDDDWLAIPHVLGFPPPEIQAGLVGPPNQCAIRKAWNRRRP